MESWVPPFTFRRSQRAKRVSLRLDPVRGLEVVLPKRATEKQGLSFLSAQRAWVERHLSAIQLQQSKNDFLACPDHIILPSVDKKISIEYIQIKTAKKVSLATHPDRLLVYGDVIDFNQCVPLMVRWLKDQAKEYLPQLLEDVSKVCGLSYSKVSVRGQKTVWGSCSVDKSIQLNYKLILLPKCVARYVMVHELCHTAHLNHSKAFWNLVAKHMPDYQEHERALKKANQLLPVWLL